MLDDREVVGDEQVGEPSSSAVVEQVRIWDWIETSERGDGLVADDEPRLRPGRGRCDALALAPRDSWGSLSEAGLSRRGREVAKRLVQLRALGRPWTWIGSAMMRPTSWRVQRADRVLK